MLTLKVAFSYYFPISTNQLAVLLTECWTTNQISAECVIYASSGISNAIQDNSNVTMRYCINWQHIYVLELSSLISLSAACMVKEAVLGRGISECVTCSSSGAFISVTLHSCNSLLLLFLLWTSNFYINTLLYLVKSHLSARLQR